MERIDVASARQRRPFEGWMKGMPALKGPATSEEIAQLNINILARELSFPCAIVKESALRQNEDWMSEFARKAGVKLCPHGKTTMSPELFARQLAKGAWGITAATAHQVRVMREFGVNRIFLANQLVDPAFIRYVVAELNRDSAFEFYCLVDSTSAIDVMKAGARRSSRPLNVLVEIGQYGARTGVRTSTEALHIAQTVSEHPELQLTGVETYEFSVAGANTETRECNVARLFEDFIAITRQLDALELFKGHEIVLSAGGSSYFDLAAKAITSVSLSRSVLPLIRSGCYLTSDELWLPPFMERMRSRSAVAASISGRPRPAIEVWAYIQSRPEPTRAFLTLGKRDVSYDIYLPRPIYWYRPDFHELPVAIVDGTSIESLNDQHAFLRLPIESPLTAGDMVAVGISHPCTTFDKWRALLLVDDRYNVLGALSTCF